MIVDVYWYWDLQSDRAAISLIVAAIWEGLAGATVSVTVVLSEGTTSRAFKSC
jgi:hypothetical protein